MINITVIQKTIYKSIKEIEQTIYQCWYYSNITDNKTIFLIKNRQYTVSPNKHGNSVKILNYNLPPPG